MRGFDLAFRRCTSWVRLRAAVPGTARHAQESALEYMSLAQARAPYTPRRSSEIMPVNYDGQTRQNEEVILDGGSLFMEWRSAANHILMTGPATRVLDGVLKAA